MKLSSQLQQQAIESIRSVQTEIRWKPDSDIRHLNTRKKRGHLASDATLETYHAIIKQVVTTPEADVYLFHYNDDYPTVVALLDEKHWLVMVSIEGMMETAFVVEKPSAYLNKPNITYMGKLEDLLA